VPGAIVVAGTPAPGFRRGRRLVTKTAGTVVHLRVLPGSVGTYAAAGPSRHRLRRQQEPGSSSVPIDREEKHARHQNPQR
jgi:hypothetical protein